MPKLVLHFEALKNTKIVHVLNKYVANFIGFFVVIFGLFLITLKKTTRKIKKLNIN